MREIGRELGVDAIVEGTVLRSDERVRISAQLVDARSDSHLWAEEYERGLRDVLSLQAEVARAIANEIRIKLTSREQKELQQNRVVDPEAYELYLKGRFHWNRRTPDAVRKSAGYFQLAIERDPSYAAAHAGLADCAGVSGFWCFANPAQGCRKAKMAAQRALQLEETAEAHSSLGWAVMHYDYDFQGAEKEFRRAIAINPRYATAHQWYGQSWSYMARFEEACAVTHKALELEPLSLIVQTSHAAVYWVARQWDRSMELCLKILDFDPNFVSARCLLAHIHQALGRYDDAVEERQRAVELTGGATFFRAELAGTLAAARRERDAGDALEELLEISKVEYVSAHSIALIHAGLNDADRAFQWLGKAFEERSAILAWIKTDPRFDNLRPDPRFNDLLRRMRFPIQLAG